MGLAIFLTVTSNTIGIALIPLWLKAMLGRDDGPPGSSSGNMQSIHIDLLPIFIKLLLSNLAPTLLGKGLRAMSPTVATWVASHTTPLAIFTTSNLSLISYMSLSSARDVIVDTKFGMMLLVLLVSGLVHVVYLGFNAVCMILLRVELKEAISVVLLGSMKAPPVAFTVITYITSDPVTQGLLNLPSIAGGLLSV